MTECTEHTWDVFASQACSDNCQSVPIDKHMGTNRKYILLVKI